MVKNINYVKYIKDTGEIRQWGTCKEDNVIFTPEHMEDNLLVLEGIGTNSTHYVDTISKEIVSKSSQPSTNHIFDYTLKQWIDPRTLADMKIIKWAEIKQARDLVEFGEFIYNGMVFDGDVDAQRRLAGYISISKGAITAGTSFEASFTLANNTEVVLTAQDFVGIELAKVTAVAAAFVWAATLRLQINAATSMEQLALIN